MTSGIRTWFGLVAVVLGLSGLCPAWAQAPAPKGRFVWVTYRLRTFTTVDNQLRKVRKVVLLKLDTATGKIWEYSTQSLTVDPEGKPESFGHFKPLDVEGIPEPAPKPAQAKGGKKAPKPPPLKIGRFTFVTISLPRPVLDATGEKKGVFESDELFLVDTLKGQNWVFETKRETVKQDDQEVVVAKKQFTRIFNADELVVVEGDPRGLAPKPPPYKLKKTLQEWRELFLKHHNGHNLKGAGKSQVDAVIVLSKDDSFTPLVVMREKLKDSRAIAVPPWQVELYSNRAVDYLCNLDPVPFDKADRYAIYITVSGRTAKGFNPLQTHMIGGMPDHNQIGKLLKAE